jgi:hypothetical protein
MEYIIEYFMLEYYIEYIEYYMLDKSLKGLVPFRLTSRRQKMKRKKFLIPLLKYELRKLYMNGL